MEIFSIDRLATYLAQGGVTMWFIGALSILGVGCALERFWDCGWSVCIATEEGGRSQ